MEATEILQPYAQGDWLKVGEARREILSVSPSGDSSADEQSKKLREKDLVLRGPTWNYNRLPRTTDDDHYDYLLFGKLRTSLFAPDDLILKGKPWQPLRPMQKSFVQYLFRLFRRGDPEATALLEAETGRSLKYGELIRKARSLSAGLRWIGLMPGQIVAVVTYNSLEAVLVVLATLLSAGVPAPIDATLNPVELGTLLRVIRPRLVFTEGGKTLFKVETSLGYLMTPRMPKLIVNTRRVTRHWTVDKLMREPEPMPAEARGCRFDRPVLVLFTGGVTDTSKAVLIPERYFTDNKMFMESVFATRSPGNTIMLTGPIFWTTPIYAMFIHLSLGNRVLFFRGPPPVPVVVESFRKYQVYVWFSTPSSLVHLLHWPVRPRIPNLKMVFVSGAYFPLTSYLEVRDNLFENKVYICQVYGLTEGGMFVANTPPSIKPESIGKVFFNVQMKVVEKESGLPLGPNKEGEMCFKSPNMMLGYYGNTTATANAYDPQGFVRTGDLGYYDDEGWVYFTERQEDLIKWRSYHVSPFEVAGNLLVLPSVKEAAVVGIPNELDGELVAAAVVLNPGFDVPPIYLEHFANTHLSENKRIRGGVHVFAELPKTSTGKPVSLAVRQMILERILDQDETTESIYRSTVS